MLDGNVKRVRLFLGKQSPVRLLRSRRKQQLIIFIARAVKVAKDGVNEPELTESIEGERVDGLDVFGLRGRGGEKIGCSSMFFASSL